VVGHDDIEVEGAQATQLFDHEPAAIAHLAEVSHAGHGDGLAGHGGAQALHRGEQHAAVAFGVGLGRPEAQDVGLVPDLPHIDLRVALRQHGQALRKQARIAGRELVEVAFVAVALGHRGGVTRRAHQVSNALEALVGHELHHAVDGLELELPGLGLHQHPVQADAHPLQIQLFDDTRVAGGHLGRKPLELHIQTQEILPHHRAHGAQHLIRQSPKGPTQGLRRQAAHRQARGGGLHPLTTRYG